jgi:hypothetical protein
MKTGVLLATLAQGSYDNNPIRQPRISLDGKIVYSYIKDGSISAYDGKSGNMLWQYAFEDAPSETSSPSINLTPDGQVLLALTRYQPNMQTYLKSFDGVTGKLNWEFVALNGTTQYPFASFSVNLIYGIGLWTLDDTSRYVVNLQNGKGRRVNPSLDVGTTVGCGVLTSTGVHILDRQDGKGSIVMTPLAHEIKLCC